MSSTARDMAAAVDECRRHRSAQPSVERQGPGRLNLDSRAARCWSTIPEIRRQVWKRARS